MCNAKLTTVPAHCVLLRVYIQYQKWCERVAYVVTVSFKRVLMRVCYETQYSSVYEQKRMLFSCSKVWMLSGVSWGDVVGSQHGDQIPERKEQGILCWVLGTTWLPIMSCPRLLLPLASRNVVNLEFNFITVMSSIQEISCYLNYSVCKN